MKKLFLFAIAILLSSVALISQEEATFSVNVSTDSVLIGHYIEVSFELKDASGKQFSPPQFKDFDIVGGPNQSSSMSFVNGEMSQSQSFSFYVRPREEGSFYIEPSSIEVGDQVLETHPIEIRVYPNPDGIKQPPSARERNRDFFSFPSSPFQPSPFSAPKEKKEKKEKKKEKKKKKRKIYKI